MEGYTWTARRARPNRMVKGFENVDMAIPLTRPVPLSQHFTFLFYFYSFSDFLLKSLLLSPFFSFFLFLLILFLRTLFFFFFFSLFHLFLSRAPFPPKKGKHKIKTDQEYCRSLFLSIILPFLLFLLPADAGISSAEVVIAWRRRRRRRRMIRREGLVGAAGGGWW